jgi:hypothetical protein
MRKVKIVYDSNREKIKILMDHKRLAKDLKSKVKIDEYFTTRRLEINRKRTKIGPFVGSLTK